MFFRKSYLVEVCFAGGNRPYTYLWQGSELQSGDIVVVPTGAGSKPARVAAVYLPDDARSIRRIRRILRKADFAEQSVFSCADRLRPDDLKTGEIPHKNLVIAP